MISKGIFIKPGYRQKGEPPKAPTGVQICLFFSLPSHSFKPLPKRHCCIQTDASLEQLRRLLQQNPEQQVNQRSQGRFTIPHLWRKKTNLPALWRQRLTYNVSLGTSKGETLPKHFLYLPFGLGSLLPLKGGTRTVSALSFQGFHPVSSFLGKISVPSEVSVPLLVPRCATWGYTVRSQHTTSKGKSRINFLPSAPNELMRFTKGAGPENWPKSPGDLP